MARTRTQFACRECGAIHPRWMGKCPDCGTWDALEEFVPADRSASRDPHRRLASGDGELGEQVTAARPINEITDAEATFERISTGIGELDRVLGGASDELRGPGSDQEDSPLPGATISTSTWPPNPATDAATPTKRKSAAVQPGLVPGSAVLLGGDPGIGKSTLMLQAANALARAGRTVLYVTSEESAYQLRLRAERLKGEPRAKAAHANHADNDLHSDSNESADDLSQNLYVLADTNLARIVEQARKLDPALVVVDSVQMIYKGDLPAAPGSVSQLRACCLELVYFAKASGAALVLVGHVTKEGALAGPRLLEHMVDTVLHFEGDRFHSHRVVRGMKNRFGNTLEVGLFEMTDRGLAEVTDGSGLLAAEYQPRAGSVVCPVLHGSRCLLVEIQALTATGLLGSAKRKVSGLDRNRLAMLIAVLEKRAELRLADQDVFASAVGGLKVVEPAADLAVALAIAGSHFNRQLDHAVCAVGEIGLGGELRHTQQMERRLREADRLGFDHILCPPTSLQSPPTARLITVKTLEEAIGHLQ